MKIILISILLLSSCTNSIPVKETHDVINRHQKDTLHKEILKKGKGVYILQENYIDPINNSTKQGGTVIINY